MLMHTESVGYSTEHRHVGLKRQHSATYAKEELEDWEYSTGGGLPLFKNPLEPHLILWRKTQPESEWLAAGGVASTPSLCSGITTGRVSEKYRAADSSVRTKEPTTSP